MRSIKHREKLLCFAASPMFKKVWRKYAKDMQKAWLGSDMKIAFPRSWRELRLFLYLEINVLIIMVHQRHQLDQEQQTRQKGLDRKMFQPLEKWRFLMQEKAGFKMEFDGGFCCCCFSGRVDLMTQKFCSCHWCNFSVKSPQVLKSG